MLRSLKHLEGYTVAARDGDIGSIANFLVDDESWTVRYLVAQTSDSFGADCVLIPPGSFRHADWLTKTIHVQLTMENAKRAGVPSGSSQLRSVNALRGYHVVGSGDQVGQLEDFIVDARNWEVRYLILDTGKAASNARVLVAPHWASRVRWDERTIYFYYGRPWDLPRLLG